jgi:broad-specificity NMP kinase
MGACPTRAAAWADDPRFDTELMNRGTLMMLSGAPGSGKTSVVPSLRNALPGVVVLDLDDFLEAGSRLAGVDLRQQEAADLWPAHNDLCLTFAATVLGAGHDVLLLSPLTPPDVGRSTTATVLGDIRWAVLDCSDTERVRRLRARGAVDVDGALTDAAELRGLNVQIICTDHIGIDTAAQHIADWADSRQAGCRPPPASKGGTDPRSALP